MNPRPGVALGFALARSASVGAVVEILLRPVEWGSAEHGEFHLVAGTSTDESTVSKGGSGSQTCVY